MFTVALHHGLFGYDALRFGPFRHDYWRGIDHALIAAGNPVIVTRATPTGSIARRAADLKDSLLRQLSLVGLKDRKLILIGHSMGGLDARYLVSRLGFAEHVAAIITVCTPHRGSPFADYGIRHLDDRFGVLRFVARFGIEVSAFRDLTTTACARFNTDVPDVPGVAYFSVSATRPRHRMSPWGMLSHKIVHEREGDNDGLVSLTSARWGTHLATWKADHWHSINRRMPEFGPGATGDIAPYYVKVVRAVVDQLRAGG